jgi:hypothetical protein
MRIGHGADNFKEILDIDHLVFAGALWKVTEDKE